MMPQGRIQPPPDAWERILADVPEAPALFTAGTLPRKSPELWRYRNPRYRGQLIGCCVGESGAAMAETSIRTPEPLAPTSEPCPAYDLSPLWVYWIARRKSVELGVRSILNGEGAIVSHALQAVIEQGFIAYEAWPATERTYREYADRAPYPGAEHAPRHKPIKDARRLTSPDQILEYMAGGYSVWIGVPWGAGNPDRSHYFAWAEGRGGHAVELLGYDLDADRVCIGNSWDNVRWGHQPGGYAFTSWAALARTLAERRLATGVAEAVVVKEVEGPWAPKVRSWADVL